jgi:hypothetical protein
MRVLNGLAIAKEKLAKSELLLETFSRDILHKYATHLQYI